MFDPLRKFVFVLGCVALSNMALAATETEPVDPFANLFSASATITTGGTEVLLTNIPEGRVLIVTQYCGGDPAGFGFKPALQGSLFGVVATGPNCTSYTPGVLLQGGQSLSCVAPFPVNDNTTCMITGYKIKR